MSPPAIFASIVAAIVIPPLTFFGGVWILSKTADRESVLQLLHQSDLTPADKKPLNERLHGYCVEDVRRHWGVFREDSEAVSAERRFLIHDLIFPFLYGGGLAASLLIVWEALGRPCNPAWLIGPVACVLVSDWIENSVQLSQLNAFVNDHTLNAGWIRVASLATITKLCFAGISLLFLAFEIGWVIYRGLKGLLLG